MINMNIVDVQEIFRVSMGNKINVARIQKVEGVITILLLTSR